MLIDYNVDKLKNTLRDFYNVTGVVIQLLKSDFSSYEFGILKNDFCLSIQESKEGKSACHNCDTTLLKKCRQTKKAQIHTCHAGLVDIAVPILYNNEILGYIILGQMKNKTDFKEIKERIEKFSVDISKMEDYYNSLSYFDYDRIESISKIATMLTKYILLEDMLKPAMGNKIQTVVSFIENNLQENLTVELISKNVYISKSVIYKGFHEHFNCTLKEYVNIKRVEKATELLESTELSMEEIALKTGFSSAAYFAKIFKKIKGTSPLKFKKNKKAV